jgi:hypothetical protein
VAQAEPRAVASLVVRRAAVSLAVPWAEAALVWMQAAAPAVPRQVAAWV